MPTLPIETGLGTIFYTAPEPVIAVAPDLIEDHFEDKPFLRLERLRLAAAPEIDACELVYVYGTQLREGETSAAVYAPLDIKGQFVRVTIPATVEGDEPIIWYGQVMAVRTETFGTPDDGSPLGIQHFTALGLLHLLDKVIIDKSFIDDGAGDVFEIDTGLPFNLDQGGEYPFVGNFAAVGGQPVFALKQRSSLKWSAADIVKYLLYRFAPKKNLGLQDANPWAIDPAYDLDSIANWFEFSVETDLRTAKQVLDEVLSRQRGMSYYVRCEPDADTSQPNLIYLVPFSFAVTDVALPSGATLAANPDQRTLDFEKALDVVEAIVSDITTARYHKVRVFGEYMTTTFTTNVNGTTADALIQDWTSGEVTSFLAGASAASDYPADAAAQAIRNAIARSDDKLRNVFARYRINENWNERTLALHDDIATEYLAAPLIGEEDAAIDPVYNASTNPTGETLWLQGARLQHHLPLKDRFDYSGTNISDADYDAGYDEEQEPHFIPLLAYIQTDGTFGNSVVRDSAGALVNQPSRFAQVEKLNLTSFDDDDGRRWACHVHVRDSFPGIEVRAHPPQMLGTDEWNAGTPATTDDSQNPTKMNGLYWPYLYVTMTLVIPKRLQHEEQILAAIGTEPLAELAIRVPDARLDYVVPYTTVRVSDGIPIVTASGGTVRDDRMRIADIARGAAEWYGDNRKTLSLAYKQVRNLFALGWLITDIGANYSPTGVNTPITSVEYLFPERSAPITKVETAFAALDYGRGL